MRRRAGSRLCAMSMHAACSSEAEPKTPSSEAKAALCACSSSMRPASTSRSALHGARWRSSCSIASSLTSSFSRTIISACASSADTATSLPSARAISSALRPRSSRTVSSASAWQSMPTISMWSQCEASMSGVNLSATVYARLTSTPACTSMPTHSLRLRSVPMHSGVKPPSLGAFRSAPASMSRRRQRRESRCVAMYSGVAPERRARSMLAPAPISNSRQLAESLRAARKHAEAAEASTAFTSAFAASRRRVHSASSCITARKRSGNLSGPCMLSAALPAPLSCAASPPASAARIRARQVASISSFVRDLENIVRGSSRRVLAD